jgi:hypothetical protein
MQLRGGDAASGTRSLPVFARADEQDAKSQWVSSSLPSMVVTTPYHHQPLDDVDEVESTLTDYDASVQQHEDKISAPLSHSSSSTNRSIHVHYHFPVIPAVGAPMTNIRERTSSNGSSVVVETRVVWTNDNEDVGSATSTQFWNNTTTVDRRPDDDVASVAKSVRSFDNSHVTPKKSTARSGEQAMTGLTPVTYNRHEIASIEKPTRFSLQYFLSSGTPVNK